MTVPAISVDALSKVYRLSRSGAPVDSFREALLSFATAPVRRFKELGGGNSSDTEEFWALRDVSFSVEPGEVVGIVGKNGAGKSTLLKILSRIVEPTFGRAVMRGRVASLLEVGTGFHPELSGRENIYLNGSILGMRKREIDARFDEIVAFAEIERFLDTPVKRYSSGMYVRLAFAVAAHLEPEILIVDEVLAVGDAEFQKRCMGKMKEVSAGGGRTVLFVSHNMAAVRSLCTRAILLRKGQVVMTASSDAVVSEYLDPEEVATMPKLTFKPPRNAGIWMTHASLLVDGDAATQALMGAHLVLRIEFKSAAPTQHPRFGYVLQTVSGDRVLNCNNRFKPSPSYDSPTPGGVIECDLGTPPLMPGRYVFSFWLGDLGADHHHEAEVLVFEVLEKDLWGLGQTPPPVTPLWWPTEYKLLPAAAT